MLEVLAGVPTVVYGFFAALTVAPLIRDFGTFLGLDVASERARSRRGATMGIMIIPFVSSLSDDAMAAVPNSLREGSLALGANAVGDDEDRGAARRRCRASSGAVLLAISRGDRRVR